MRVALRLVALAVALAAASAAAGAKQPSLASIDATAPGEGNGDLAAANLCVSLVDQVKDRSDSNTIREASRPDWRIDDKAIADCRLAADGGDAAATYNLGVMYRKGLGVPQDSTQAAKWFRKAADLGLAWAQTNLGLMYAAGEGVPQSRAEAVKWIRMAAEQGDDVAQYALGRMYCDGRGDPQDFVQAYMWLNLAAAQGLTQAGAARDQVAAWIGSPAEIAKAQQMAVERGAAGARVAGEVQPRP